MNVNVPATEQHQQPYRKRREAVITWVICLIILGIGSRIFFGGQEYLIIRNTVAAMRGDAEAQVFLGQCYYYGEGVGHDAKEAVRWFKRAAEQGNAGAQYGLGVCYLNGTGVEEDVNKAVRWFKKAAEQGEAEAQYCLGICYDTGEGVDRDAEEAVRWYRKAAEQGGAEAQYCLGVCYHNGTGVEEDVKEAVRWFTKAAEQGDANAQFNLGICYDAGEGVSHDVKEAVRWFKKAAEQGEAKAQLSLGLYYCMALGVTRDLEKALVLFREAEKDDDAKEILRGLTVAAHRDNVCVAINSDIQNIDSGLGSEIVKLIRKAHGWTVAPIRMWLSDVKMTMRDNFPYVIEGTVLKTLYDFTVKWDATFQKNGTTVLRMTFDNELNQWTDIEILQTDAKKNTFEKKYALDEVLVVTERISKIVETGARGLGAFVYALPAVEAGPLGIKIKANDPHPTYDRR